MIIEIVLAVAYGAAAMWYGYKVRGWLDRGRASLGAALEDDGGWTEETLADLREDHSAWFEAQMDDLQAWALADAWRERLVA